MGRSYMPKYRVEILEVTGCSHLSDFPYEPKRFGRASAEGLQKMMAIYNESFEPAGVNHIEGSPLEIRAARLIEQATGRIVAEWSA